MSWWAIDVRPPESEREKLGAWLVARTGQAVEERPDGTLVAFAPDEATADALLHAVGVETGGRAPMERRPLEQVDWSLSWRAGLRPRQFGRLELLPSWLAEAGRGRPYEVVLDPENAFGSGEHGSTRAALTLIERHIHPGDRVLDLGSGSGILSIAAAKLAAGRVVGIEIDPEANAVAQRNAVRNRVAERVVFVEGDAGDLAPLLGPVDLLVSNILRTVNTALLPAVQATLPPDGLAIFSGMETGEAERFRADLRGERFELVDETTDAGWWAVAALRPRGP